MKPRYILGASGLCVLALVSTPVLASEPGNLMKITSTTRMSMGSMHMPPPTRTDKVCTSARKPDYRDMVSRNKECRITQYRKAGNIISFHMACGGDTQMSGNGSITLLAGGGIHYTMHMAGTAGGRNMSMDIAEDGVRIGSCAYTPPPGQ